MALNGEKMFGAELPVDLIDAFTDQVDKDGFVKKKAVEGLIRLFLALPHSARSVVVSGGSGAGEELRDILREIVQDVIDQGYESGKMLRQKQKP